MTFQEYWTKAKVPSLERMTREQLENIRKIALQAFNTGKRVERQARAQRNNDIWGAD